MKCDALPITGRSHWEWNEGIINVARSCCSVTHGSHKNIADLFVCTLSLQLCSQNIMFIVFSLGKVGPLEQCCVTNFWFSSLLTGMGIKLLYHAALLDFTNVIETNRSNLDNKFGKKNVSDFLHSLLSQCELMGNTPLSPVRQTTL